jgi:short-chain fatty acids transporter
MAWVGSKSAKNSAKVENVKIPKTLYEPIGAEKIEHSSVASKLMGVLLLILGLWMAFSYRGPFLGFINPNYINFTLLALCILLHRNIHEFLIALDKAISGASGILIQFPIYFGILALMQSGGLIEACSDFFISISNESNYPIFTFLSAGIVNVFVPSGGGQWAIQGPIILEAASSLQVPLEKSILALAYGDQWTNMLQPFWALPLLSITGLKARDILPYTFILFLVGAVVFMGCLFLF